MNPRLITILFLMLALALYYVGLALTATVFLVLGGIAEMTFWVLLFRRGSRDTDCQETS